HDHYKTHDIEIVIDRLLVQNSKDFDNRLSESIKTAMYHGEDTLMVLEQESGKVRYFSRTLMCLDSGISYANPEPNTFSFNSPKGACPNCNGLGIVNEINLNKVIPNPKLSIRNGGLAPLGEYKSSWIFKQLEIIGAKFNFKLSDPIESIPQEAMGMILNGGNEKFSIKSEVMGITRDYKVDFEGIANFIKNQYNETDSSSIKRWAKDFMDEIPCPTCEGSRLKKEALFFKVNDKNIYELASMDIQELYDWFLDVENHLSEKQKSIAHEIVKEITTLLKYLLDVVLNYLNLNRSSASLSGGQAQRIRLATKIGSQLVGVLYILDEPSNGLHQRDNEKLIASLKQLRDIGNSVLVVEHDKDMILESDYVIDIGPFAGRFGGKIVSKGTPRQLLKEKTLTASYLNGIKKIEVPKERRKGNGKFLKL